MDANTLAYLEQTRIALLNFPSDGGDFPGETFQHIRAILECQQEVLEALVEKFAA